LTGRTGADVEGSASGNLRGMLLAAFGSSRRDPSRPNVAAAAQALGVTSRTVQRWLAAEGQQRITHPRPETLGAISRLSRQAATTRRGRARALAAPQGRVAAQAAKRGMSLRISGKQGIDPDPESEYIRRRATHWHLDPSSAAALQDAWVRGGDKGALDWLASHSDIYGVSEWTFHDIEGIEAKGLYDL
jgi:hypothetical protein